MSLNKAAKSNLHIINKLRTGKLYFIKYSEINRVQLKGEAEIVLSSAADS